MPAITKGARFITLRRSQFYGEGVTGVVVATREEANAAKHTVSGRGDVGGFMALFDNPQPGTGGWERLFPQYPNEQFCKRLLAVLECDVMIIGDADSIFID